MAYKDVGRGFLSRTEDCYRMGGSEILALHYYNKSHQPLPFTSYLLAFILEIDAESSAESPEIHALL